MKIYHLYGLGIAAGLILLLAGCGQRENKPDTGKDAMDTYTCPMHPEVVKDKPGICPICGMDLVRKEAAAGKIKGLDLEDLLQPTNGFVLSSVPVITARPDTVQPELNVVGTIGYDTRLQNTIAARVSGRIEKLYVRYRYQRVRQGQRIMDLYSPDLAAGEQQYLYLLKNDSGNTSLIGAARQRLLLLGVNEGQLAEVARSGKASATLGVYSPYSGHIHDAGNTMPGGSLGVVPMAAGAASTEELPVKEGMYVEKGQNIFQVFDMSRSWALLRLFPGQESGVHKGDPVEVVPETAPGKAFTGRVDLVEPLYRTGDRSLTVRVYFDNGKRNIPIGSAVKATIRPGVATGSWLPKEAVVSLGENRLVFLRQAGGFRAHKVLTGLETNDRVQVLAGLATADSVAANAQFLVDSEDFIKVKSE